MAAGKASRRRTSLGNAKPIQPISSRMPAGMPNRTPSQKGLDVNAGERKARRVDSTRKTRSGGRARTAYQRTGKRQQVKREKRSRRPGFRVMSGVKGRDEKQRPRSMAGNMRTAVSWGKVFWSKKGWAATRK